jgi:hypothetical protein
MSRKALVNLEHKIKSHDPKELQYAMYVELSNKHKVDHISKDQFFELYEDRELLDRLREEAGPLRRKYGINANHPRLNKLNEEIARVLDRIQIIGNNMPRNAELWDNWGDYRRAEEKLQPMTKKAEMKVKIKKSKEI